MKLALLSGAHVHTRGYLKTIGERDDLELAVVWDDMPARGREIAEQMGCRYTDDLDDAVATNGLDATVICADNAGHRPLLEASAAAGLDCFCEKPMALTVDDADAMLEAIRASRISAVFGFFQPYQGAAVAARRFIDSGGLGEVTQLTYRNSHHAAYGRWFDSPSHQWFVQPWRSGGGAFCDMGAHAMHFVRLVFGPIASVSAVVDNKSRQYPDVDDLGIALCQMTRGATAVIEASWVLTGGPTGLEAVGSKGYLTLRGNTCEFTPFADGKRGEKQVIEPADAEPTHLDRLIAVREGKLDPAYVEYDLRCCRDAVAVSCAAYESMKTGFRVPL